MENRQTAIVLGATGLVGKHLVRLLIEDDSFSCIKLFVRRPSGFSHPKIEDHIVNFETIPSFGNLIAGDVLFSCLGTTLKQAGTKKEQYKVDYDYQFEFAKAAANNGVKNYCLVSSTSANAKSRLFYSRMKGELEDAVIKLPFNKISIIRPSVLVGKRNEKRNGEIVGAKLADALAKIIPPLKKYRSIKGSDVARVLLNSFVKPSDSKVAIFELEAVHLLLK
jgi:uncharacterized protein YbjT (DUF2867 family)